MEMIWLKSSLDLCKIFRSFVLASTPVAATLHRGRKKTKPCGLHDWKRLKFNRAKHLSINCCHQQHWQLEDRKGAIGFTPTNVTNGSGAYFRRSAKQENVSWYFLTSFHRLIGHTRGRDSSWILSSCCMGSPTVENVSWRDAVYYSDIPRSTQLDIEHDGREKKTGEMVPSDLRVWYCSSTSYQHKHQA